jgi:hypothetical protein
MTNNCPSAPKINLRSINSIIEIPSMSHTSQSRLLAIAVFQIPINGTKNTERNTRQLGRNMYEIDPVMAVRRIDLTFENQEVIPGLQFNISWSDSERSNEDRKDSLA